jgi:integrase
MYAARANEAWMAIHKLTARFVETAKDGLHSDGGNLFLQVRGKGRSWIFQYKSRKDGRQKNMGLGSAATTPLADARQMAQAQHRLFDEGKDPLEERKNKQLERDIRAGVAVTVKDILDKYYEAKIAKKSRNYRKSAARFLDRIRDTIGEMPVAMVTTTVIRDKVGLGKLWDEKRPSAIQLHSHLKRIFSMAKVECGLASNPAAWVDNLEHLLSDTPHKVEHHAALAYKDVPKFLEAVRNYEDHSCRKTGRTTNSYWLEFVILTGVRVSEVRHATWSEIDYTEMVWNVPPGHRKTGYKTGLIRAVPITKPMLCVLKEMERRHPDRSPGDLVFSSPSGGKFNENTVARFVRTSLKWPTKVTPHGFRSSLNDWRRANGYPKELIDVQLDHLPDGKVEQAYTRDDLMPERRKMMEAWGAFCDRPGPYSDNVVDLRKAKA